MVPLKPFAVPYVVVPRECRVQFPKPCFKGLKWGRWDCNVRGGAAESSVIRIACDLWVVRRVDRTPVFGRRPKDAAYHTWGASGLCSQGLLRCWTRLWWRSWPGLVLWTGCFEGCWLVVWVRPGALCGFPAWPSVR